MPRKLKRKQRANRKTVRSASSRRTTRTVTARRAVIKRNAQRKRSVVSSRVPTRPQRKFRIDWAQSYTSLLLGIIIVVIGVLFVASIFRSHPNQQVTSISTQVTTPPSTTPLQPKTYTVQPGDDLWHIAEKEYNDGYQWVIIARANNITNPSFIYKSDKLIIPVITPTPATSLGAIITTPTPSSVPNSMPGENTQAITADTYTVQPGDDLWHIALRKYADGYRWVDIARANNLAQPNYIHKGDILKLPR